MFHFSLPLLLTYTSLVIGDIRRTPGDEEAMFTVVNHARVRGGVIQYFEQLKNMKECMVKCMQNVKVSMTYKIGTVTWITNHKSQITHTPVRARPTYIIFFSVSRGHLSKRYFGGASLDARVASPR